MRAPVEWVSRFVGVLLLIGSVGPVSAGEPEQILIDDFESGLRPEWVNKSFAGHTDYRVIPDQLGHSLMAVSQASASGLVYEFESDPGDYPILAWRWKIADVVADGDGRSKAGDDYAARVYVIFPHWFFPKTRTLNYIWANRLPKGTVLPNAYTGNAMMIAVESGPEHAGHWQEVSRDLRKDFRQAFGEELPAIGAIAIMTDTDNTGGRATAWYDDLRLCRTDCSSSTLQSKD